MTVAIKNVAAYAHSAWAEGKNGTEKAQVSAQLRALLKLRELILSGELAGGTRIAEPAIVERLGMSRTPIRAALMRLEQEGLLEALPNGGYAVKTFSERDIADAIELRGTLEGLLVVLAEAKDCLRQIDAVLAQPALSDDAFSPLCRFEPTLPRAGVRLRRCHRWDHSRSTHLVGPSLQRL